MIRQTTKWIFIIEIIERWRIIKLLRNNKKKIDNNIYKNLNDFKLEYITINYFTFALKKKKSPFLFQFFINPRFTVINQTFDNS